MAKNNKNSRDAPCVSRTNTALAVRERIIRDRIGAYGYSEIRLPIVEKKQNFSSALWVK